MSSSNYNIKLLNHHKNNHDEQIFDSYRVTSNLKTYLNILEHLIVSFLILAILHRKHFE